jgi:1-acyl-sn-glycerol-3-phosphate acyltransferase
VLQKLFYQTLKLYCRIVLNFYFSKWQIRKLASIPSGPVIFVANHQNAFLDAVVVICSSHRNPWALARANVFKNKWAKALLTVIQMMPVYRFRDGFDTLRKNEAIMDQCATLLGQGKSVLIFGEGNHNEHYNLRPLQKGFARMAQAALQQNTSVQIVPVGIHYEAHHVFRSRVLVSFGNAIRLEKNYFEEHPIQKTDLLLKEVADQITPWILSIPENNYKAVWQHLQANRKYYPDMVTQLHHEQEMVNNHKSSLQASKEIKVNFLQKIIRSYYALNHWPARWVVRRITGMPILDPQFIGSIKFAAGMIVVPLFYVLQASLVALLSGSLWITAGYLISLPLSVALLKPQ